MVKYACVTGADRGVGLELVRQLLQNGYVVFAGRYQKHWTGLEDMKTNYGQQLELIEMDISDDTSVKAAARIITEKTDYLDILINNAAILGDIDKGINDELDFKEMLEVFNTNALGALRVTNALFSLLCKSRDRLLVNISSEAGSIKGCERKGWFGYCMSKSALNIQSALMQNIFEDYGGQVLVIHPGWVRTYMRGVLDENAEISPEESASGIMGIILQHEKYKGSKPAYIDYLGNELQW